MDKFDRLGEFYRGELVAHGGKLSDGHYLNLVDLIWREVSIARAGRQSTREAAEQIELGFHLHGLPTAMYG